MKKGLPKTYVSTVEDIYQVPSTQIKCVCGETEDIEVKAGVYQGLTLNTYLFS